jgi:hypothetical protein
MRRGNWKVFHDRKGGKGPVLFDLSRDPGEADDLSSKNPEVLEAMLKELDTWGKEMLEPRWGPGAPGENVKKKKSKKQEVK